MGAALFVFGDAFGQPSRHALIRHLQRDDVAELVPERGFPLEVARRTRLRRVERDHAAETRAQRADHAGQAERPDGEIVVLGEHLDQDGPLRRELVLGRHRAERLVRERDGVFLEDRGFFLAQLDDQIAVANGLELVERVEQAERVERDDIVRVDLERGFERRTRLGLVARAEQLRAEVGERARVVGRQRQRPCASAPPLLRTGSYARRVRRPRGTRRRDSARWPAPWRPRLRTPVACPRRTPAPPACRERRGSTG